ncbi:MAG: hypothetical protein WBB45_15930 [Cyclobacteriaceae bacterium]
MANCNSSNPVKRDGTSQDQRRLKALLPGYVSVDERSIDDLKAFAQAYAEEIRYYYYDKPADSISDNGHWAPFFEHVLGEEQRTTPHYALFIAFLEMFSQAQADMNQFTRKHLEFYYTEVLQLKERPAVPDQAFVIFELAKHVTGSHVVPEGTELKAGKDSSGKEVIFTTQNEIAVNKASVDSLKAAFVNKDDKYPDLDSHYRVFASSVADSADGQGADIETEEKSWRTFGSISADAVDRPQADLGFAIASPVLFMAEGNRDVIITLHLAAKAGLAAELAGYDLDSSFTVQFSGEKEWISPDTTADEVENADNVSEQTKFRILEFLNSATTAQDLIDGPDYVDYSFDPGLAPAILIFKQYYQQGYFQDPAALTLLASFDTSDLNDLIAAFSGPANRVIYHAADNTLTFRSTLQTFQEAVVAYDQDALADPFTTEWPVARILLNPDTNADPYLYRTLRNVVVNRATVRVDVTGVKELTVQNEDGLLDAGKPFEPFSTRPVVGSDFYIGSWEVFQKNLDRLQVNLLWHGLPEAESFYSHYVSYNDEPKRYNNSFTVRTDILHKKKWKTVDASERLFNGSVNDEIPAARSFILHGSDLEAISRNSELTPGDTEEFDTDTLKGFLRLELNGRDFGHRAFAPSYTEQILKKVQYANDDNNGTDPDNVLLPNEPYTPTLESLSLNYTSEETFSLNQVPAAQAQQHYESRTEQYFNVHPFGVAERHRHLPGSASNMVYMLPFLTEEGNLYVGIRDLQTPGTLSLLFKVAEGSSDPDLDKETVNWSYLSQNRWVPFNDFDILSDSTSDLLTSGIVRFNMPKAANDDNTLLPAGMHWIRASVTDNSDAISKMIAVHAQAVLTEFSDRGNDPLRLEEAMPAGTIKKLVAGDPAIKGGDQLYSSFGGRMTESGDSFYIRTAELLRHKLRAVTIWDYEHLILEEFPDTYKVKCLNHTRYEGNLLTYSELAACHVTLIVISNVRNMNAVDPLRPKTSKIELIRIEEFLSAINSAGAVLHVQNPLYEEVKVRFNVRLYPGYDAGHYRTELNEAIKSYLAPWAYKDTAELVFGGEIFKSAIINFIEHLPYVDYVTCFQMFHIVPGNPAINPNKDIYHAQASAAVSVIGTVDEHDITILETEDCECENNDVQPLATIAPPDHCGEHPDVTGVEELVIGDDFIVE